MKSLDLLSKSYLLLFKPEIFFTCKGAVLEKSLLLIKCQLFFIIVSFYLDLQLLHFSILLSPISDDIKGEYFPIFYQIFFLIFHLKQCSFLYNTALMNSSCILRVWLSFLNYCVCCIIFHFNLATASSTYLLVW